MAERMRNRFKTILPLVRQPVRGGSGKRTLLFRQLENVTRTGKTRKAIPACRPADFREIADRLSWDGAGWNKRPEMRRYATGWNAVMRHERAVKWGVAE